MEYIRRQLTLFISSGNEMIETIRKSFNPIQYNLIPAHVTLCREDELGTLELVLEKLRSIGEKKPIRIEFEPAERFDHGKGVLVPAKDSCTDFFDLRKSILMGSGYLPEKQRPHITLMHPRNSTCTDEVFAQIKSYQLPTALDFNEVSLIEQRSGVQWKTLERFPLMQKF